MKLMKFIKRMIKKLVRGFFVLVGAVVWILALVPAGVILAKRRVVALFRWLFQCPVAI